MNKRFLAVIMETKYLIIRWVMHIEPNEKAKNSYLVLINILVHPVQKNIVQKNLIFALYIYISL